MNPVDIFISYAWRDNEPPVGTGVDPDKDRWVWMFRDALHAALGITLGRDAFVWIDKREIKTNDRVETVLSNALARSRLLLTLMSPSWLNSDWCRLELNEFKHSHPGTKLAEFIFVIEIGSVARSSWQELVAVKGLKFYSQQPSGTGHVRFGHPLPNFTDKEYHNQIVWLACEIRDLLNISESSAGIELTNPTTFSTETGVVAANAASAERSTPAVLWIADTTPELANEKRDLIQAVRQAGFAVIMADIAEILRSPQPEPLVQLMPGLGEATLIVQMVSIEVGESAPDHRSWARFQADLAMKVAHERGVPYIRWRRPGASLDSVADPLHRELLTGAIEQRMEELRSDVVKRLQLLSEPVAKDESKRLQNGPSVCISYTEDDLKVVAGVEEMLRELNVDYVGFQSPSRFESATDADRHCADEDRAIAESAGVIIVYGQAAREWLTTKIMRANQLRGRRRQQWGALVDAPSPGKTPAPIASSIRRLDWHAGPRIDLMKQFVESLVGSAHV